MKSMRNMGNIGNIWAIQKPAGTYAHPRDDLASSPGLVAATGRWTIHQVQGLIAFISIAAAVLRQSCRPLTWRRTVRSEFFHQCHRVGTRALPFIMLTALIAGMGIVFETLYWLKVFGQSDFAGSLLVVVLVRDRGPGVAPRHLTRLFEPFYRGETELTRRTKGTGIGLALVKGLVERMDAGISGRNAEGGGFEVSIDFRAAPA